MLKLPINCSVEICSGLIFGYLLYFYTTISDKYHVVTSAAEERSMSPAAFSPQPVIVQTANYSPYR